MHKNIIYIMLFAYDRLFYYYECTYHFKLQLFKEIGAYRRYLSRCKQVDVVSWIANKNKKSKIATTPSRDTNNSAASYSFFAYCLNLQLIYCIRIRLIEDIRGKKKLNKTYYIRKYRSFLFINLSVRIHDLPKRFGTFSYK